MNTNSNIVKEDGGYNAAPLRNLVLLEGLVNRAMQRKQHLPGLATFSGPSGFGKSTACAFVAQRKNAFYLEVRSTWTKKAFLQVLLTQMGIPHGRTIHEMVNQVATELACTERPLILDEFDNACNRGLVEMVRDIYEMSYAPIILVGEESLPQKLQMWERFHGRVFSWVQAQPADLDDARSLNRHYEKDVFVEDDLLAKLVMVSKGSVRRIVTNLNMIADFARGEGIKEINAKQWGGRELQGSRAPTARNFDAA